MNKTFKMSVKPEDLMKIINKFKINNKISYLTYFNLFNTVRHNHNYSNYYEFENENAIIIYNIHKYMAKSFILEYSKILIDLGTLDIIVSHLIPYFYSRNLLTHLKKKNTIVRTLKSGGYKIINKDLVYFTFNYISDKDQLKFINFNYESNNINPNTAKIFDLLWARERKYFENYYNKLVNH